MRIAAAAVLLAATSAAASDKVPKAATAGAPAIAPGEGPAFFVYHDDQGWHVRWTGGKDGKERAFTGIINVPGGRIARIMPRMAGGNDSLNRVDQTRAFFKSETGGAVEGMDFRVEGDAGSIYLELFIDYDVLSPKSVHLGRDRAHPPRVSPAIQIDLTAP